MRHGAVDESIRAIAEDRTSGASKLARLAVETMGLAILEAKGRPHPQELAAVARRISEAQPAMAIVHNVTQLVARLVAEGHDPTAVLTEVRAELDTARARIARTFLKIAPQRATVVTLSYSENVLEAVKAAHARGGVAHAFVLESPPMFEGRTLAKSLSDAGISATIVRDADGPARMADASFALVGADSVLRDGAVVNKIGTRGLALAAADSKKPFYVVCETFKFDARYDAASWPGSAGQDSTRVGQATEDRVATMNRLFDVTPGDLVTTVVTERGTYAPDMIRTMLASGRGGGHSAKG